MLKKNLNSNNFLKRALLAPFIWLVVHVCYQIHKNGIINAWRKSIARKGSFTADFHHFLAMIKRHNLHKDYPTKESKISYEFVKSDRKINADYVRKTKERHPPDMKDKLRKEAALVNKLLKEKFPKTVK